MPRKYLGFLHGSAAGYISFNEAGADAPEIHRNFTFSKNMKRRLQ